MGDRVERLLEVHKAHIGTVKPRIEAPGFYLYKRR